MLLHLVEQWDIIDKIVYSKSYVVSVGTSENLNKIVLRFIIVVKIATNWFRIRYLSEIELVYRGDSSVVVTKDEYIPPNVLAFTYMDSECW